MNALHLVTRAEALAISGLGHDPQTKALLSFVADPGAETAPRILAAPRRDLLSSLVADVPADMGDLAAAIADIDRHASWTSYATSNWSSRLADRSATATIVGPWAPITHDNLAFGVFCVGPDAVYHEHLHPAREVYLIVNGSTEFLTVDGWRWLGPGETSVQEPDVIHALRTGERPVLCFWVWTGDVGSPISAIDDNGGQFFPKRLDT